MPTPASPNPARRPASPASPAGRPSGAASESLSDQEFEQLRELVYRQTGIDLSEGKRVLLASRLFRRINTLGLKSYGEYYQRVVSDRSGQEMEILINSITTNKTDFFRESHHFRYLQEVVFPRIRARAKGGVPKLRIWSAGCSTGEEPYSIAMTIADAMGNGPRWDVRITATDLDTQVLAKAAAAIYPRERTEPVPTALAQRWLRPTGQPNEVTVASELKAMMQFQQLNFVADRWPVQGPYDAIFFRNVAIYFDRPTQDRILRRMVALLEPDGDLIVGHSESLHWLSDLVVPVANTVYRKKDAIGGAPARPSARSESAPPPSPLARSTPEQPGLRASAESHASHKPHAPHKPATPQPGHGSHASHKPHAPHKPATPQPGHGSHAPHKPHTPHTPRPEHGSHAPHKPHTPHTPQPGHGSHAPHKPHSPHKPHVPASPAPHSSAPVIARATTAAGEPPMTVITVGGVFASRERRIVRTLLGSCIAACLWDPVAKVGGMNHFLLPDGGASEVGSSRFGVHAMELLINEIMKCGGDRRRLEAKVFGGGHVLRVAGFDSSVPKRNAEFVRSFLAKENIRIVAERLGGHSPLEVKFDTYDGRAWVHALEATATQDVALAEERFVAEAKKSVAAPPSADVELF
ncbi:MAG: CheR family methyltransferase [bacterium]